MKSTLLIDAKDIEENIALIEKQIQLVQSSSHVNNQTYSSTSIMENLQRSNSITSSTSNQHVDNLQTNYSNTISTTA